MPMTMKPFTNGKESSWPCADGVRDPHANHLRLLSSASRLMFCNPGCYLSVQASESGETQVGSLVKIKQ